jgi:hypothetical protein
LPCGNDILSRTAFLAGGRCSQCLQELFAITRLDQIINVVVVNDA